MLLPVHRSIDYPLIVSVDNKILSHNMYMQSTCNFITNICVKRCGGGGVSGMYIFKELILYLPKLYEYNMGGESLRFKTS